MTTADAAASQSILGRGRSLRGRVWRLRPADPDVVADLHRRRGLPVVLARVLAARGVDGARLDTVLMPRLRDLMPDPDTLADMPRAAARLADAVEAGETVAVFGDYDVDGATSSAVLARYLRGLGSRVLIRIPDRVTEGYGPNTQALLALRAAGAELLVTVDCGITAFEPLAAAAADGLPAIVIDHHLAEAALPEAIAVVNPNRQDDTSGQGHLAAVGVVFLLLVATNRVLRQRGWFGRAGHPPEPDLRRWLDLVALGTVCDMVPLAGLNRAYVVQGLRVLTAGGVPGLAALCRVAGLAGPAQASDFGFRLGPRLNAGGRIGACDAAARLLASDDAGEIETLAAQLDGLNRQRQEMQAATLLEAMEQLEGGPDPGPVVLAASETWHPGVIGLVAARLAERWARPAAAVAVSDGVAKGSVRSVPGVDMGRVILAARTAGLLSAGGGHAMAAGFTTDADRLPRLRTFLAEAVLAQSGAAGTMPGLDLDGTIDAGAVALDLAEALASLEPYGQGFPEPVLVVPDVSVRWPRVVGQGHVQVTLENRAGDRVRAIAFGAADDDLGVALLRADDSRPLHVAGSLLVDTWNGTRRAQVRIADAAVPPAVA